MSHGGISAKSIEGRENFKCNISEAGEWMANIEETNVKKGVREIRGCPII